MSWPRRKTRPAARFLRPAGEGGPLRFFAAAAVRAGKPPGEKPGRVGAAATGNGARFVVLLVTRDLFRAVDRLKRGLPRTGSGRGRTREYVARFSLIWPFFLSLPIYIFFFPFRRSPPSSHPRSNGAARFGFLHGSSFLIYDDDA